MYYLGIDGGGTKTKAILVDDNAAIIHEKRYRSCNYIVDGYSVITDVLQEIIDDLSQIGINEIESSFFAIAGYGDVQNDVEHIDAEIKKIGEKLNITCGNDTENALAGSLGGNSGINIIAGTGSIGLGMDDSKQYYRSGGWHHLFGGDEGSAYWIACELIREFTKQSDGRHARTRVYTYLKEKYNFEDDSNILELILNEHGGVRNKIASMAEDVYVLATLKDPCALMIYDRAAKELSEIVVSIYGAMGMRDVSVSYSGGVFKAGEYILEPFTYYLSGYDVSVVSPLYPPEVGSLILAFEAKGIKKKPEFWRAITDNLAVK